MRFAGQRFRSPRQGLPNQRAQSGYINEFSAPASIQGLEGSMNKMSDKTAGSMVSVTQWPDMSKSPFSAGNYQEPEFRV